MLRNKKKVTWEILTGTAERRLIRKSRKDVLISLLRVW